MEKIIKDEQFFLDFVKNLSESQPIEHKYTSKLEEIANRVRNIYEKIFEIEKIKKSLEEDNIDIQELSNKVIIRIIEILAFGISKEESVDGDYKKGIEELYKKGIDLSGFYDLSKEKLKKIVFIMDELRKKYINGINDSIQLSYEIKKHMITEIKDIIKEEKLRKYDYRLNLDLFPNLDNKVYENTIGNYLDSKRKKIFELGAVNLFVRSIPQDIYGEINKNLKYGTNLMTELEFSLVKQVMICTILNYIGKNEKINFNSLAFPTDNELEMIKKVISSNTHYQNENYIQYLKNELFELFYNEEIVKGNNSQILEDYYKIWLQEKIDECLKIVLEINVEVINGKEEFYSREKIEEILNPTIDPGYERIDEIKRFDQKHIKKLKDKKKLISLLENPKDYNIIEDFVNSFCVTNILHILEEIKNKDTIVKIFKNLLSTDRIFVVFMYLGYGFNDFGEFEKVLNIDNSPLKPDLTAFLDELIYKFSVYRAEEYQKYLVELKNYNYGEGIQELKYEARYEKEGMKISEIVKKYGK